MHQIDNSCCKNRGCNKCDCLRKENETLRTHLESAVEEIENMYGRETNWTISARKLINRQ